MRRYLSMVLLSSTLLLGLVVPPSVWAQPACVPTSTLKTAVVLAWTLPAQPPGATTTAIQLYQAVDGGTFARIQSLSATATTANVTGLSAGHSYAWAINDTGTLADGSTGASGFGTNGTPPPCVSLAVLGAPTNLTATPQ